MPGSFVHLHNHTEYSLLDGAVHIKDNLGAITDAQQAEGWTLACQALVDSPEATIIYE